LQRQIGVLFTGSGDNGFTDFHVVLTDLDVEGGSGIAQVWYWHRWQQTSDAQLDHNMQPTGPNEKQIWCQLTVLLLSRMQTYRSDGHSLHCRNILQALIALMKG
jgi:hypothetical protein